MGSFGLLFSSFNPFWPFFVHLYLYSFLIVMIDVPVIALIFLKDNPLRSRDISRAYCSFIFSSDFR